MDAKAISRTGSPPCAAFKQAELQQAVDEAACRIRDEWSLVPHSGIILGTGLGTLVEKIDVDATYRLSELGGFPEATALGHRGHVVCGTLEGVPVVALQGRLHRYEGHTVEQLTLPIRLFRALGVELLIISSACGALNAHYQVGDLVVLDDAIRLPGMPVLCAQRGAPGIESVVGRFTAPAFEEEWTSRLVSIARQLQIPVHRGTYLAVPGPNYETRAEIRFMRSFADVVGMSTVPEAILARSLGMIPVGISTVTNLCRSEAPPVAEGHAVIQAASTAAPKLRRICVQMVRDYGQSRYESGGNPTRGH